MIIDFNPKGKGKKDILRTADSGTMNKKKVSHMERVFCE